MRLLQLIYCDVCHTFVLFDHIFSGSYGWIMIISDGEHVFPERANSFKAFLKKYLFELDGEHLLEEKTFVYDIQGDEFLESEIQAFYTLWSPN